MIYQSNEEFKIFPYKAIYDNQEIFITSKEQFELDLLERLQMEENHRAFEENREPNEVELPDIEYVEVTLTEEQEERFNFITKIKGLSLDEVNDYVIENIEPDNPSYHSVKLTEQLKQTEIASLSYLVEMDFRLSSIELGLNLWI